MREAAGLDLSMLDLPRRVHACVAGDWIVFLDLTQDRYFALPASEDIHAIKTKLAAKRASVAQQSDSMALGRSSAIARRLPKPIAIAEAAWWAHRVVKSGRLDCAFDWIEREKARAERLTAPAAAAHEEFERMRAWIPHRYVCLFNALTLIRFLLLRNINAELVFGVRGMPFAAHCWVEAGGGVLDPGEEDCGAFIEIARV